MKAEFYNLRQLGKNLIQNRAEDMNEQRDM